MPIPPLLSSRLFLSPPFRASVLLLAIWAPSSLGGQESPLAGGIPGGPIVPRVMQAFRLPPTMSIRVDGRLTEEVWEEAPSAADVENGAGAD